MKSLFHLTYRLSFFIIFILAISCKKDSYVDEENELVFPVNFTFTNFKSSSSYLKSASSKQNLYASSQIPANYSEGYIYFWSFNNETLTPDIKYSKSANPSITYNDGKSIIGVQELLLKIIQLEELQILQVLNKYLLNSLSRMFFLLVD